MARVPLKPPAPLVCLFFQRTSNSACQVTRSFCKARSPRLSSLAADGSTTRRKKEGRGGQNHESQQQQTPTPNPNNIRFVMNEKGFNLFWENYHRAFQWQQNSHASHWKARAKALEVENSLLRDFIHRGVL